MKNKIFKIFGIILFAQVFLYACCGGKEEYNIFISSITLSTLDATGSNPSTVTNEDFRLFIDTNFDSELVTSLVQKSGFINTANAVTCLDYYNVINPVTNINVEANVPLFDVPAGESLNNYIFVAYMFDTNSFGLMSDLISELNDERNDTTSAFLKFNTVIPIDTSVIFKITLTLENGEQFESSATEVTFE
ncbi:hypothetical protein [Kordia sp.]|uniref:hypothetical protein n=1 Tax=Kordia sp. TaxID=1965332 RepID=UPI003B599BAF